MVDKKFWQNKKVFITGHTGFKGSWLSLWLHALGANVAGYAFEAPTDPSLFKLCNIDDFVTSTIGDIRNLEKLTSTMQQFQPDIVIHMAAQPIVRLSYKNPVETYTTNVMGTVNLFEAVRHCRTVRAVVNVTTDKCYDNKEWIWGYRETDVLGGYDPYSSSKACAEMVTSAYRNSYFNPAEYQQHGIAIATARAGNVIGGGDFAIDRLLPDCLRALWVGEKILIRSPYAIRPWQHVFEPLNGYLQLAQRLYEAGPEYGEAWNFGPNDSDVASVLEVINKICAKWSSSATYEINSGLHPHEANYLKLDCSKAKTKLDWHPKWNIDCALDKVIEWSQAYIEKRNILTVCLNQIEEYSR